MSSRTQPIWAWNIDVIITPPTGSIQRALLQSVKLCVCRLAVDLLGVRAWWLLGNADNLFCRDDEEKKIFLWGTLLVLTKRNATDRTCKRHTSTHTHTPKYDDKLTNSRSACLGPVSRVSPSTQQHTHNQLRVLCEHGIFFSFSTHATSRFPPQTSRH